MVAIHQTWMYVALPLGLIASAGAISYADVAHDFSSGEVLTHTNLNENFQGIDTRITALENTPKLRILSATVNQPYPPAANDCAVTAQSSQPWIESVAEPGENICMLKFFPGTFSAPPMCFYQDATGHSIAFTVDSQSATGVNVNCNGGSYGPGNLLCVGPQ